MSSIACRGPMWQFSLAAASIVLAATAMAVSCLKNEQKKEVPPVPAHSNSENDRKVLVVGCGTIGSGFASVFLGQGQEDSVYRRSCSYRNTETASSRMLAILSSPWYRTVTGTPPFENLEKKDILENAAKDVDFVQECVFEDVDIKRTVLAKLDSLVDPAVIIASSTSFIPWTLLFEHCKHQHRLVIGHPAIPYMRSYIEVYGVAIGWTNYCKSWYTDTGFDVVVMKKTLPGHVFNSFLRVNLEHAHMLVRKGFCTPEDVNTALRHFCRDIYGRQSYLSLLTAVGGSRGFEGGIELSKRVQNDGVYLTLFSSMKQIGYPDIIARVTSRCLGRMIAKLIPGPPEEYIATAKDMHNKITEDGQVTPQIGMFRLSEKMYKTMPLEVGNDPFSLKNIEFLKMMKVSMTRKSKTVLRRIVLRQQTWLIPTKVPRLSVGRILFGPGTF